MAKDLGTIFMDLELSIDQMRVIRNTYDGSVKRFITDLLATYGMYVHEYRAKKRKNILTDNQYHKRVYDYLSGKRSPYNKTTGNLRTIPRLLCQMLSCEPFDIFPLTSKQYVNRLSAFTLPDISDINIKIIDMKLIIKKYLDSETISERTKKSRIRRFKTLMMYFIDGMSVTEIAQKFKLTVARIYQYINSGIVDIRRMLRKDDPLTWETYRAAFN